MIAVPEQNCAGGLEKAENVWDTVDRPVKLDGERAGGTWQHGKLPGA